MIWLISGLVESSPNHREDTFGGLKERYGYISTCLG